MKGVVLLSQFYKGGKCETEKSLVLTIFNPGITFIILFDQKRETGEKHVISGSYL